MAEGCHGFSYVAGRNAASLSHSTGHFSPILLICQINTLAFFRIGKAVHIAFVVLNLILVVKEMR